MERELTELVTELCRAHPHFRRITIERLVERTALGYRSQPRPRMLRLVRRAAAEQLSYADQLPEAVDGAAQA